MSDLFENLDLQMREEAEAKNPQSAILASQMETDKRFASFIANNGERAIIIQKELKEIADKYASRYDVDPKIVFEATVSHLVESADLPDPEKFWEEMGMGDKYKNKMRKKERSDEQLAEWSKKHMQHDPKAVLESTDERLKDDPKCDNCGTRAGVTDYGLGNFCSIECGQKYRDKMEKDSSHDMNIPEEDVDQLNMLNDILDAEDAEDYDTVKLLSKRYKETYGPITREMLNKARNMDFTAPKEEDLASPIRGEEYLMDALDDRYASVKRSMQEPPWYLDTEEELENWRGYQDGLAEMESDRQEWQHKFDTLLTPEEKALFNAREDAYNQLEYEFSFTGPRWQALLDEFKNIEGLKDTDPEKYNSLVEELKVQMEQLVKDKQTATEEYAKNYGERNNPKITEIYNKLSKSGLIKQAGFVDKTSSKKPKWTEKERISAMKEIQKAKANGVPHDEVLNMMEDYRSQFGRNFSTDSRKEAADHYDPRFDEVWKQALEKLPEERLKAMTDEEIEKVSDVYKQEIMVEANNPADPTIFGGFHLDVQETNYDRLMQELADRQSLDSLDENESMMAYASKQAALAEFLTIHEATLFPAWMRKEGETWQDILWRTNRQTPETMPGGNKRRQDDSELVRGQQGLDFIQQSQGQQPYDQFGDQETTEIPVQRSVPESPEFVGVTPEQSGGGRSIQERFQQHNEQALGNKLVEIAQRYQKARKNTDKDAIMEEMKQLINETKGRRYISSNLSLEKRLVDFYVSVGISEKTASIFVESVGELAQLQQDAPGFPVAAPDPDSMDVTKEIGGGEGDKYKNWDVAQKQKALDLEHQDFTDFGDPVREFVQPGGEAPYSENTKEKIDKDAESVDMGASNVTQADNAPKKSSTRKRSNEQIAEQQGQQALEMVKDYFRPYLEAGYPEPKLIMDWDWVGGTPTPSIVWEEGPSDWAIGYTGNHNRFPKGAYGEPATSWALSLYPDDIDYSQEGDDNSSYAQHDPEMKAEYEMLMKEMGRSSI